MILFILLARFVTEDFALRFAVLIVGGLQLFSLPLAKSIIKDVDIRYADQIKEESSK